MEHLSAAFAPASSSADLDFSDGNLLDLEKRLLAPKAGAGDESDLVAESSIHGLRDGEGSDEEPVKPQGESSGAPWSRSSTFSERSIASCESFVSAASRLEPFAEREELEKMFKAFDENGDGKISQQELGNTMRKLGYEVSESELESMVVAVDNDGDGFVDFDEFLALYSSLYYDRARGVEEHGEGDDDESELREAFDVFDRNRDGFISVVELQAVLSSLGLKEGMKLVDCQKMIKAVDVDGDGLVNFDEFKNMMGNNALFSKQ